MDPSEIIAVPFPVEDLQRHVCMTMVVMAAPFYHMDLPREILHRSLATAIMYAVLILCGVHPLHNVQETLWAALYLTTILWPVLLRKQKETFSNRFYSLVNGSDNAVASFRFHGTLGGIMVCSILAILDWGLQIQRWPLPLVIGGTYGCLAGSIGSILCLSSWYQKERQ